MHITHFLIFLIIKLDFIVYSKYKQECIFSFKREKPKHISITYYLLLCSDFYLKATSLIYNESKNASLGYKLDRKNPNKLKPISIFNLLKSSWTFLNNLSLYLMFPVGETDQILRNDSLPPKFPYVLFKLTKSIF